MTAFVASLTTPRQAQQRHLQTSINVRDGEKLFESVGCSACHMRKLGPAEGIYSDLLLHDMGPGLADPVTAVPELTSETAPSLSFGYFGSSGLEQLVKVTTNIRQEWRTPPLWGVRESAPYLHDGRADTLEKAIRLHRGESKESSRKFLALKPTQKDLVIQFLNSLAVAGGKPQRAVVSFGGAPF